MGTTAVSMLVVRADASTEIGTGHVMRCLALAQAWQDAGGQAIFVMAMKSLPIEARLRSEGFEVVNVQQTPGSAEDAVQTEGVANQHNAEWIVLDGYQFYGAYQREIKKSEKKLLCIDDYGHADHYYADVVLNQNLHAHDGLYSNREENTKLLLGTRYVLLRREFLKWQGWKRKVPPVARRILVTFGGGNDQNVTCKVVRALKPADLNGAEVSVIIGPTNPDLETIRNELMSSPLKSHLLNAVDDMATLMAGADIAISSAGSTCWELAFMGLPSFVLPLANNQVQIAKGLDSKGVAIRLDAQKTHSDSEIVSRIVELIHSRDTRSMMAEKGQKLVDGEGPETVLMHMRGERLRLRSVRETDSRLLWEWANDPDVRAVSFSTKPISWDQHAEWIESRLSDPNCAFYLAINVDSRPIGSIRYEIKGTDAVASINLDREFRRQGYGSQLIQMGEERLFNLRGIRVIHAHIKLGNQASIKAFLRAGFKDLGKVAIDGHHVTHLVRQKDQES